MPNPISRVDAEESKNKYRNARCRKSYLKKMFTGLIQSVGELSLLTDSRVRVTYASPNPQPHRLGMAVGDSIAVDGVCLTVEEWNGEGFVAAVSPETLRRTTLGYGDRNPAVNLEWSLRVGDKLGGHFVTGHVDGVGSLDGVERTHQGWELWFSAEHPGVARYVVPKGSIAVNGVSLTVAGCSADGTTFRVAMIPHTFDHTTFCGLQPGDRVNLEGDVLGKYVERFLRGEPSATTPPPENLDGDSEWESLSPNFLQEHGYL